MRVGGSLGVSILQTIPLSFCPCCISGAQNVLLWIPSWVAYLFGRLDGSIMDIRLHVGHICLLVVKRHGLGRLSWERQQCGCLKRIYKNDAVQRPRWLSTCVYEYWSQLYINQPRSNAQYTTQVFPLQTSKPIEAATDAA